MTAEEEVSAGVFLNSFIPRTLDEVVDIERDMLRAGQGDTDDVRGCSGSRLADRSAK